MNGRHVPAIGDLAHDAVVLRRGRVRQRRVVTLPQVDIVRTHQAFDRVGQVLCLKIGELALLRAHFNVEQVVVDLRHQALQRNATLRTSRSDQRGLDVARIDKTVRRVGRRNPCLFEETRRMPGRWNLLDTLAKDAAALAYVCDFGLVAIDLDRARPHEIGCRLQIDELCSHIVLSKGNGGPKAAIA